MCVEMEYKNILEKYTHEHFIFNNETMLEYMKEERYKQEVKNEAYRMSIDLFTKYGGWVNNLQIMYEQSAKNAKAELQNILDAFLKTTKTNNQTPIYGTFTLPKEYKLPNKYTIQEFGDNLKEQKKAFKHFRKSIRDDNFFKKPTERRKQQLGYKNDWVHCLDYNYIVVYELHKKLDLHLHSLEFVSDTKEHITAYIDLLIRKWANAEIGRAVIKIDPKYKYIVLKHLKLEKTKNKQKSHYDGDEYFLNRNSSDYKKFRSGAGFFIRFFDSSENLNEKITGYVCKYIFKTRSDKTKLLVDRKNDEALGVQHIFSLIGLRPFSFSLKTLRPLKLTIYRKIRRYIIGDDDRRKELFFLLRELRSGEYEIRATKTSDKTQIQKVDWIRNAYTPEKNQHTIVCNNAYNKESFEIRTGYIKTLLTKNINIGA